MNPVSLCGKNVTKKNNEPYDVEPTNEHKQGANFGSLKDCIAVEVRILGIYCHLIKKNKSLNTQQVIGWIRNPQWFFNGARLNHKLNRKREKTPDRSLAKGGVST